MSDAVRAGSPGGKQKDRASHPSQSAFDHRGLVSDHRLVATVLLLALAIRVVLVVLTRHRYVPVHDSQDFSRIAASIASGHGFGPSSFPGIYGKSAFRTPLFPGLLAVVYKITGVSWTAGRLALAVVSTGFVGSIGALAGKVAGARVGIVALVLAAVYPPLIIASYGLNYEVLMGLLVCTALLAGYHWAEDPRWRWLVIGGALTGLAVLCRENSALALVPVWLLILAKRHELRWSGVLRRIAVMTGCAVLVVLPWTIRNAVSLHAFIPVSDSPGFAVACAYNATTRLHVSSDIPCYIPTADPTDLKMLKRLTPTTEVKYEAALQKSAITFLENHPGELPTVVGWNVVRLFDLRGPTDSLYLAQVTPWPVRLLEVSIVSFYVVAVLALVGGVIGRRFRPRLGVIIWVFPVLWCVSLLATVSDDQYRLVAEPFLVMAAAAALVALWGRFRTS